MVTHWHASTANGKTGCPTLSIIVHCTKSEPKMEYQRIYTELRTARLSFAQFMDFLGEIHALGLEKGRTTLAGSEQPAYFAAAPLEEALEYRANQ